MAKTAQVIEQPEESCFPTISQLKQRAFLAAFAETGNQVQAAKVAGVDRRSHYNWLKQPEYADAWEQAKIMAGDSIEAEIVRRATGYDEEAFYQGEPTGHTIKRYSDILLIFLMKGWNPNKYHDRHEVRGQVDSTINVTIGSVLDVQPANSTKLVQSANLSDSRKDS